MFTFVIQLFPIHRRVKDKLFQMKCHSYSPQKHLIVVVDFVPFVPVPSVPRWRNFVPFIVPCQYNRAHRSLSFLAVEPFRSFRAHMALLSVPFTNVRTDRALSCRNDARNDGEDVINFRKYYTIICCSLSLSTGFVIRLLDTNTLFVCFSQEQITRREPQIINRVSSVHCNLNNDLSIDLNAELFCVKL